MKVIQQLIQRESDKIYEKNRKFEEDIDLKITTIGLAKGLLDFFGKDNSTKDIFFDYRNYAMGNGDMIIKVIRDLNQNMSLVVKAVNYSIIMSKGDRNSIERKSLGGRFVWMVDDYG